MIKLLLREAIALLEKNGYIIISPEKVEAKSQREAIVKHLEKFGSITSVEAFIKYGATRLSGIIFTLRRFQQMPIISVDKKTKNRFGHTGIVTVYKYEQT